MANAHTPGPWEAKLIGSTRAEIVANGQVVARTAPVVPREAEPTNARLIAAAPALLEALEHCMSVIIMARMPDHPAVTTAYDLARAAIAQAKGTT